MKASAASLIARCNIAFEATGTSITAKHEVKASDNVVS